MSRARELAKLARDSVFTVDSSDNIGINSTSPTRKLDVSGNVNFQNEVSVGGTLTYEDVTNIDAVGVITAREGIHAGAGVSVVGVGTFTGLDISGDIDVDGHTDLDNVSISGVVTATTFVGDGNKITGIVTHLVGGDNISVSATNGQVTITGAANTSNILADTLIVSGVSTVGVVTGMSSLGVTDIFASGNVGISSELDVSGTVKVGTGVTLFTTGAAHLSGGKVRSLTDGGLLINTTGDTAADANIALANDGSAEFVGDPGTNGTVVGTKIVSTGLIRVARSTDGPVFQGNKTDGSGYNITLNADGSSVFAGTMQVAAFTDGSTTKTMTQVLAGGGGGGGGSSDKISEGNTEAEVVDTGSDGHFKVTTEGTERMRILSDGRVIMGGGSTVYGNANADDLVVGTTASGHRGGITIAAASNQDARLAFSKGTSFFDSLAGYIVYQFSDNRMATYVNMSERFAIDSNGKILIGHNGLTARMSAAALEIYKGNASNDIAIINSTADDSDGARSGNLIFSGRQSGGERTTLASIGSHHEGSADDEKGVLMFRTNDGSDGDSPTERLRITSTGRIEQKNNNEDINMDSIASGQLKLDGNGYNAGLALNNQGLNIYHNSEYRGIIFGTNETERVRITSTGDMGVGTNNPTAKLDVNGTLNVSGITTFQSGVHLGDDDKINLGDGNDLKIWHNGFNSIINDEGTGDLYLGGNANVFITNSALNEFKAKFITDGAVELYHDNSKKFETISTGINVTGKIGINNSTPLYLMHFKNAMGSSPSFIHMEVTGSNTVGGGGGIAFDTSASNSESNNAKYLATITGIRNSADNGSNDLIFSTTTNGVGGDLPVEKLRITSDGQLYHYFYDRWFASDASTTIGYIGPADQNVTGGSNSNFAVSAAQSLSFSTGGGTERLRITSDGKIGINNSSPQRNLDVYSTSSTTIRIQATGTTTYAQIEQVHDSEASTWIWKQGSAQSAYAGNHSWNFYNPHNSPIAFYTNTTSRMQIDGAGDVIVASSAAPTSRAKLDVRMRSAHPAFNITHADDSFYRSLGTVGPLDSAGNDTSSGGQYLHVRLRTIWNDSSMTMFRITGYYSYSAYAESYAGCYRYSYVSYRNNPYGQIIANQGNKAALHSMYNEAANPGYLVLVFDWGTNYTGLLIEHIGAGSAYAAYMQHDLEIIDSKRSTGTSALVF